MSFRNFDVTQQPDSPLCNDFWTLPIDKVNVKIEYGHQKDEESNPGVTLVVGCPLPQSVQDWVQRLREDIDNDLRLRGIGRPFWRENLFALHVTVYGLVKPGQDYDHFMQRGYHCSPAVLQDMAHSLERVCGNLRRQAFPFRLVFQGFGILGGGGIAVRVSDSEQITLLRSRIAESKGQCFSTAGYVEKHNLNQMIVGRLRPGLEDEDRQQLHALATEYQDRQSVEFEVESLRWVHYQHEFLEQLFPGGWRTWP